MVFKHSLRDSIQDSGGIGERPKHSERVYHRFFEGYTTRTVAYSNRKGSKVQYVYTAEYYAQRLTDRQRALVRCLYVLLYVLTCIAFILASVKPIGSNSTPYIGVVQAVSVGCLVWMLVALLYYVFAPKLMTIYIRRTMIMFHFRCSTIGLVCAFLLLVFLSAFWLITNMGDLGRSEIHEGISCILLYLFCEAALFTICQVEKKIQYDVVENNNK